MNQFCYFKRLFSKFNLILVLIIFALLIFNYYASFYRANQSFKTDNLVKNYSFEQGLENWKIDDEKDPILLILGAKTVNFKLKSEFIKRTMYFEFMPNSTYQGQHTAYIKFNLYNQDNQDLGSITYILSQNNSPPAKSYTVNESKKKGFIISYDLSPEIIKEKWNPIELNLILDSNRALREKGFDLIKPSLINRVDGLIVSTQIFDPNNIKFRGWHEYFKLTEDPYDGINNIEEFNPEADNQINSYINAFSLLPSDGNKYLNLSGKYSWIYQKVSNLNPRKTYLLMVDAKSGRNSVYPPKVSITDSRHKEILSKSFTPQMTQLGWVRLAVTFKPRDKQIYVRLGNGKRDGYYPFTLNQYDNIILYEVSYADKFVSFLDKQYHVKLSFKFPLKEVITPEEFSLDYKEIMPKEFAKKLEEEYQALGIPVYDLYVNENKMWHYPNSRFLMWNGNDMVKNKEKQYYSYRFGKGYRNMVPAKLRVGKAVSDVRIKTRGLGPSHHIGKNKSLKVSFNKSEYFYLLQRPVIVESFGHYIAGQMGLITLNNRIVFLRINDKPVGFSWELKYDGDALTDNQRANGYVYKDEFRGYRNIIERKSRDWTLQVESAGKSYKKKYPPGDLIDYFLQLLQDNNIEAASHFVDLDKIMTWEALSNLVGSSHQDWYHNLNLYWDTSLGFFEPIAYDFRSLAGNTFSMHFSSFSDSFLYIFENFNKRNKILWNFVSHEDNLKKFISYSQKFFSKNVVAYRKLEKERNFKAAYETYIRRYRDRYHYFQKELLRSSKLDVELKKLNETVDFGNTRYSVLTIKVIPEDNSQISSSYLRKITLKNYQGRGILLSKLASGAQTNKMGFKKLGGSTEWKVDQYLPSNFFFENKIKRLWKNQYDFVNRKLTKFPKDKKFLIESYNPLSELGTEEEYAYTLKYSLNDKEKINRLYSIFKKVDYIRYDDSLVFYLCYPQKENIKIKNLEFDLENAVTGEKIVPDIKILKANTSPDIKGKIRIGYPKNSGRAVFSSNIKLPFKFEKYQYLHRQTLIKRYPFFEVDKNKKETIILRKGSYKIKKNIIIPSNINLIIEPGVKMRFAKGISLLSYGNITAKGTKNDPIVFTSLERKNDWGVVAIAHQTGTGKFEHCLFEGGNEAYLNGIYFSGMLSVHSGNVDIDNCQFQYASEKGGDDALNFKNSNSTVKNSLFFKNKSDAVDFDFMKGEISQNKFIDNGDDAIDTSYSSTLIVNNYIEKSGDKGISIGEKSTLRVINNVIFASKIGIEVKDSSTPVVVNNVIVGNDIGINSYQKKRYFGGGHGRFYNILLLANKREITFKNISGGKLLPTDDSDIVIEYSNIPGGRTGSGNVDIDLDFSRLKSNNWLISDQKLISGGKLEELKKLLPNYSKTIAPIGLIEAL